MSAAVLEGSFPYHTRTSPAAWAVGTAAAIQRAVGAADAELRLREVEPLGRAQIERQIRHHLQQVHDFLTKCINFIILHRQSPNNAPPDTERNRRFRAGVRKVRISKPHDVFLSLQRDARL